MSKTTILIEMQNNSDARRAEVLRGLAKCHHNGRKTIIAVCDTEDLEAVREALEADHRVVSFEVR